MVPADPTAIPGLLAALPHGARLLGALAEPHAVTRRTEGRRAPGVDGPLTGVHLVGGAVRDLLRGGAPPVELDLVAERDGPAVADELRRRLDGVGHVHERFGTASVMLRDGTRIDVATARAETYPRPGALPEVTVGVTLAEDLARRDFTVNAIAVGLSPDRRGAVHAAPHALEDLAGRRLRVLHDRSFVDDPTRLLRLVRYAARLGFAVEEGTAALARAAFAAGAPGSAGVARISAELRLLLAEADPVAALEELVALAGDARPDAVLAPDLVVEPAVLRAALALLPGDGDRVALLLAGLAWRAPSARLKGWLAAIHLPGPVAALDAARDPPGLADAMRAATTPSALHAVLARRSVEAVALAGAHGAEEAARRWLGELRHVRLDIDGADLVAAGVAPGPQLGAALRRALAAKLDGRATTREGELAAALSSDG